MVVSTSIWRLDSMRRSLGFSPSISLERELAVCDRPAAFRPKLSVSRCGRIIVVVALVGCDDSAIHRATDVDPLLCVAEEGLDAATVTDTGYDGRFSRYPSDDALARDALCEHPSWRVETRACTEGWRAVDTANEARLHLLWRSWCWHGIDLEIEGDVLCSDDVAVQYSVNGRAFGSFACLVYYQEEEAEIYVDKNGLVE